MTDQDAIDIITDIAGGTPLEKSVVSRGYGLLTFFDHLAASPRLDQLYSRAQSAKAEKLAEEILNIADTEENVMKARNQIDARKWYASKVKPSKFGDRIDLNVTQLVDVSSALTEARSRLPLPMRYHVGVDEAQVVDMTRALPNRAADKQSVVQPKSLIPLSINEDVDPFS